MALPAQLTLQAPGRAEPAAAVALGSSLGTGVDGLTLTWDFGDGQSITAAQPSHAYTAPGEYTVTLTARNGAGQSVSGSAKLQVGRFGMVADRLCSGDNGNGWCWLAPLPSYETISVVQFTSPSFGFVGGPSGFAATTRDAGRSWNRLPRAPFNIRGFWMLDSNNGWASGESGLFRTRDGGRTWESRTGPQSTASSTTFGWSVRAFDNDTVLLSTHPGSSPRSGMATTDSGVTWRYIGDPVTPVSRDGESFGELVLSGGRLPSPDAWSYFRQTGLGATLTPLSHPFAATPGGTSGPCPLKLHAASAEALYAHCQRGSGALAVSFSDDGGRNWRAVAAQLPRPQAKSSWTFDSALDDAAAGLAVLIESTPTGSVSTLLGVQAGALRWEPLRLPDALGPYALPLAPVVDASTLWIVDANGMARWSEDRGATWRSIDNPAERERPARLRRDEGGGLLAEYFEVVRGVGGDIIRGPTSSRFYRSTDRGQTWLRVPGGGSADAQGSVTGLWFFDALRGIAIVSDGSQRDTDDGGRTWRTRAGEVSVADGSAISGLLQFSSAARGWLLDRGRLKTSADAGRTWVLAAVPAEMTRLADLQFLDAARAWAATDDGRLYRSIDGGQTWSRMPQPSGQVQHVRFVSEKVGIVHVFDGVFYESVWHTRDGGENWTQTNFNGHAQTDMSMLRYADASNVWMVGRNCNLECIWRSSDGGASWRNVTLPLRDGLRAIHFTDSRNGWVASVNGIVTATTDGGESWSVQAPWHITIGLTSMFWLDSHTGWIGGAAGAILATATGGR